jgi:hypothetical protein
MFGGKTARLHAVPRVGARNARDSRSHLLAAHKMLGPVMYLDGDRLRVGSLAHIVRHMVRAPKTIVAVAEIESVSCSPIERLGCS